MKTKVTVWMVARVQVDMEVEHEPGESPTDLTDAELDRAQVLAQGDVGRMDWDVERVTRG